MVPPKSDPRWEALIINPKNFPVSDLSTRMLMTRVLLMNCKAEVARRKEAITLVYDFFVKNEAAVKNDIKLIFG